MLNEARWWRWWPTMLLGSVLGLAMVPVGEWGTAFVRDAYDRGHPVVVAEGVLFERDADSVTLAISGEKHRDCEYVAIAGYTIGSDGLLRSTYIQRVDQPSIGATRPVGRQSFGLWRLWPTDRSVRAEVWISHQCGGRLVRTKVAEVAL